MPITELRIEGLRTIEKLRLTLDGLTVLIGDNGTGKSSILEACELLRRATGPRFLDEFYGIHGGLTALLRHGAKRLLLGVTITPKRGEYDPPPYGGVAPLEQTFGRIEYDLVLLPTGTFGTLEETVRVKPASTWGHEAAQNPSRLARTFRLVRRTGDDVVVEGTVFKAAGYRGFENSTGKVNERVTCLAQLDSLPSEEEQNEPIRTIAAYLQQLRINLPFETIPAWAARALDRKSALRASALLTPADHLEKLGLNLASSYHALKNDFGRAHWDATLEYLRLGLGERIEDVVTWADPGGGNIGLSLKQAGLDRPIPSSQLSDGMLSYLAFVALFRLHTTKPSLVAFDEPDLHLHPHLLMRVLDMFDAMARECPVLLATHSDRLLDGLLDPAKSVVLCELDERGATRLVRPDRETLAKWLTRYRGLGDIRGAGHAASVLTKVEPTG